MDEDGDNMLRSDKNQKKIQSNDHRDPRASNPRYKESDVIKRFLLSKMGIAFLVRAMKGQVSNHPDIISQIDYLIDFYTTWTSSFPVRMNLKVSKYDFLKHIEDYCSRNDISDILDSL